MLLRCRHVDRGIARASGDQELEVRQLLDDRARKRGALAHGADDRETLQRLDHLVSAAEMLVEHLDIEIVRDLGPIGHGEGDVLVIIEDRAAAAGHGHIRGLDA